MPRGEAGKFLRSNPESSGCRMLNHQRYGEAKCGCNSQNETHLFCGWVCGVPRHSHGVGFVAKGAHAFPVVHECAVSKEKGDIGSLVPLGIFRQRILFPTARIAASSEQTATRATPVETLGPLGLPVYNRGVVSGNNARLGNL